MESIERVGIIGSGNVASHLAAVFIENNISVPIIISRSARKARMLAKRINSLGTDDFEELKKVKLDLIIVAVNDSSLDEVSNKLRAYNLPVVHTSGATSIDVFREFEVNYGVFYPLQTLTKGEIIDFRLVPLCIDANQADFKEALLNLANRISSRVYEIEDNQRVWLHLCAVFMNNNINHLLAKVDDILIQQKLSREILQPLLKETLQKAKYNQPNTVQTGPAIRNDQTTMKVHQNLMDELGDKHLNELYQCFWNSIQDYYKKEDARKI